MSGGAAAAGAESDPESDADADADPDADPDGDTDPAADPAPPATADALGPPVVLEVAAVGGKSALPHPSSAAATTTTAIVPASRGCISARASTAIHRAGRGGQRVVRNCAG
jgi:hypothetical protein